MRKKCKFCKAPNPTRRWYCSDQCLIKAYIAEAPNGCWQWQGYRKKIGDRALYGRVHCVGPDGKKRTIGAHRLAYQAFIGPIPEGMDVDHLCRDVSCVKPDHLSLLPSDKNNAKRHHLATSTIRLLERIADEHPHLADDMISAITKLKSLAE